MAEGPLVFNLSSGGDVVSSSAGTRERHRRITSDQERIFDGVPVHRVISGFMGREAIPSAAARRIGSSN